MSIAARGWRSSLVDAGGRLAACTSCLEKITVAPTSRGALWTGVGVAPTICSTICARNPVK